MDVNLKGTFFACQSIGKYMKANKVKGAILLVSSSRGSEPAWSPYGISKWGLKGLTKGLGKMFAPYGINVNAIAPGSTATRLIGIKEGIVLLPMKIVWIDWLCQMKWLLLLSCL